jgi:hypothetical protein
MIKTTAFLAVATITLDVARSQPRGPDAQAAEGGGGGGQFNTKSACTKLPCQASLLGDVALTTVGSVDGTKNAMTGVAFAAGENIYGPFEAGFSAQQENILKGLGCTDSNVASAYIDGGIDTSTAESIVAAACGVTLPRTEGGEYISLIDECGGHTKEYHFHERMSCLYKEEGAHSARIGEGMDGKGFYGKWEDYSSKTLPKLDACGGHFGVTPESDGKKVYHYHVQEKAPFTIGCFGPDKNDAGEETLVTLDTCRSLYSGCSSTKTTLKTTDGDVDYRLWCPCYDNDGSSVASVEKAVFDNPADVTCAECESGDQLPRTSEQVRGATVGAVAAAIAMVAAAVSAA